MIKSKLKKKLERETFKRKDEILLGGLRYDLMDMHEHSGNPNLKPKPDRRLSFKERSQKHRAYMQISGELFLFAYNYGIFRHDLPNMRLPRCNRGGMLRKLKSKPILKT